MWKLMAILWRYTNATDSFNSKVKITGQTDDDGEIDNIEIMVPLNYLSNFYGEPLKYLYLIVKLILF